MYFYKANKKRGGSNPVYHFQDLIVRNRYAPAMVMATVNPPSTARLTTGLICEDPVRPYRIPSTPYVSGSIRVNGIRNGGRLLMGKSAPERPKIGKTTKFMISWNPVISSILDAIAIPKAVKAKIKK